MFKYHSKNADMVLYVVDCAPLMNDVAQTHNIMPPALLKLARAKMSALMIQAFVSKENQKTEPRIDLNWNLEGPFGAISASSLGLAKVRGQIEIKAAFTKNLDEKLGSGQLVITKTLGGQRYQSLVEANGSIYEDIIHYFKQSEQLVVDLSFDVNVSWQEHALDYPFRVMSSYGILLHFPPPANESSVEKAKTKSYENYLAWVKKKDVLKKMTSQFKTLEDLIEFILGDDSQKIYKLPVSLFCPCSLERAKKAFDLVNKIEKKENKEIKDKIIHCEFCGDQYDLSNKKKEEPK